MKIHTISKTTNVKVTHKSPNYLVKVWVQARAAEKNLNNYYWYWALFSTSSWCYWRWQWWGRSGRSSPGRDWSGGGRHGENIVRHGRAVAGWENLAIVIFVIGSTIIALYWLQKNTLSNMWHSLPLPNPETLTICPSHDNSRGGRVVKKGGGDLCLHDLARGHLHRDPESRRARSGRRTHLCYIFVILWYLDQQGLRTHCIA